MFSKKALLLALSATATLAVPTSSSSHEYTKAINRRYVTPSSQGQNNGFFYSTWSDGTGDVEYNNGAGGQYSLTWTNSGDVVVGKGFNPGAPRNITYNADYQPDGISFLSVYGWFTNPLAEYYICENWGTGNPAGGDGMIKKGSFESDGSTYDVYQHQQVNAPSIKGTTNFMQYWSIRQDRRSSGTINTANHFNYWKSVGLTIGTFDYQILATEGVKSSGKSTVTVSEGTSDAGSAPAPASSSASAASSAPASSHSVSAPAPSSSATSTAAAVGSTSSTPAYSSASTFFRSSTAAGASSSAPSLASTTVVPAPVPSGSVSNAPSASSAVSVAAPPAPDTSCTEEVSSASVTAAGASSTTGGFPGFGGPTSGAGFPFGGHYTPGAGFPFGGHHTPGATPTPHFGHHGGHHGHHVGSAYQGAKPSTAGAGAASALPYILP